MKEKVKIVPSEFRKDVATMTYPELKDKYGLSIAMLKRVMLKLDIEKPKVRTATFEIIEESEKELDSKEVSPIKVIEGDLMQEMQESLSEDNEPAGSVEVYTSSTDTDIPEPIAEEEKMFGLTRNSNF